jgi:hypothetical protein
MAVPGDELFSTTRTRYVYYKRNNNYTSKEDFVPEYDAYEDDESFKKQYNEKNFEKIRSITAKESNRFNLI